MFNKTVAGFVAGLALGIGPFIASNVSIVAGDPVENLIVVSAPAEVDVGQLVVLDASKSQAKNFKWVVKPETKNFRVDADGKQAVFSEGKPGTYTFFVAGASGDEVDADLVEVVVKGDVAPPGPPPAPEVKIIDVKEWVKDVKSLNVKGEADALSAAFEGVAAQIAAGVLTTPEQIIKSTSIANSGALGNSLNAWKPFSEKLRVALNQMADEGKLATPADHAKVWAEIAKQLEAVAGGK